MQAIKVQIYFSEWEKVSDFISEINIDAQLKTWFTDPTIETIKKQKHEKENCS